MKCTLLVFSVWYLLGVPVILDSCGMGPPVPTFVAAKRPADIDGQFLKGRLGVVHGEWETRYLIGAFRMLSGKPLTANESAALYPARLSGMFLFPPSHSWESMRARWAVDPIRLKSIDAYKRLSTDGMVGSFLNCNDDAFDTAVATARLLLQDWGLNDDRTVSWVLTQNQVFANCSSPEPQIPQEPNPAMDPLLASHRRYQIAAARFYAGQYRQAAADFLEIAKDTESPWWTLGEYLAARALMRAGELTDDPRAYQEAKVLLQGCLRNPDLEQWHAASRGLLERLQLRIEPYKRIAELDLALRNPAGADAEEERIRQTATDFAFLLNRSGYYRNRPLPDSHFPRLEAASEMAAWIMTVRSLKDPSRGERAVAQWRKSRKSVWLVAALKTGADSELPVLLEAARRVSAGSPAFESVNYFALLREAGRGRKEEARLWADRALGQRGLVVSARNLIAAERMKLARDFDEFLTYSLRRAERAPTGTQREDIDYPDALPDGSVYAFDEDSITAFHSQIPLQLWMNATQNRALPAYLQLRVAQSGWFRAVMLGRFTEARQLLTRVVELNPRARAAAQDFLTATDAEQQRFAALFLYLKAPGLAAELRPPWVENENLAMPHVSHQCPLPSAAAAAGPAPEFLTADDRSAASAESKALTAAQPWVATESLRAVLAWAARHPDDGRVPEALHRAVLMSRYGCKDEETGMYSKRAFELLHAKYGRSVWAAETKYWFR